MYYKRYKRFQLNDDKQKGNIWNNSYIFDIIPSVFPTLGIFCTALGITIGMRLQICCIKHLSDEEGW